MNDAQLQAQVDKLVIALAERIDLLKEHVDAFEPRLAGLENVAADAIGSAHKCVTNAIGRAEVMIKHIDTRVETLEKRVVETDSKVWTHKS